jgi:hypothetical protein
MADLNLSSITGHRNEEYFNDDNIIVNGKIDDNCKVTLVSRNGSITIKNKIDNNCIVTLRAAGDVSIGTEGDSGDRKIDNNCTVSVEAGGAIQLGHFINNHCSVSFTAGGSVSIGNKIDDNSNVVIDSGSMVSIGDVINNHCQVEVRAVDDVSIGQKIDDNSNVTIDTLRGAISIQKKIDNHCTVYLTAAKDIRIGISGAADNRYINNACHVYATSGREIVLGDKIGDQCLAEFRACNGISIGGVVERGCRVFLETSTSPINVRKIRDDNTELTYWGGALNEAEPRHESPTVRNEKWSDAPMFCSDSPEVTGEWWQDWGWKYGYVAERRYLPNTLEELVSTIGALGRDDKTKAVGGGWSFTDASLPFDTLQEVDSVSIEKRGIGGKQNVHNLLEGAPSSYITFNFDHQPTTVLRDRAASTTWNPLSLTNEVVSGFNLPGAMKNRSIVDTRRLASSLHETFSTIASTHVKAETRKGRHFFHVEAGITIADLNVLLDHQRPRLAIEASGGSPGATLAGTLSSATHGGEFRWTLLVDRVKAIHLVGPGGQEWWIEGKEPIADFAKLSTVYPNITAKHFIGGEWRNDQCLKGLTPQDVLKAVAVSMGVVGVIYSVVLEVVPAYGIRQKAKRIEHWDDLLSAADVTVAQLRDLDDAANRRLLEHLLNGEANGTGIAREDNVYVDLAINPIDLKCWIINRQRTEAIPRASKALDLSIARYEESFRRELNNFESGIFGAVHNEMVARLMDFLNYGRSLSDVVNDISQIARLLSFVLKTPPLLATVLSVVNAQTTLNERFRTEESRMRDFLGGVLTGLLNVLMGTVVKDVSDITDLSFKVGAIGWSDEGTPGKGFEISLPPGLAFSFLQSAIIDPISFPPRATPPIAGYISIRICPQTETLMGMQQFAEQSVMIEIVGARTPESLDLFKRLQQNLFDFNRDHGAGGMLHWGLENDLLDRDKLEQMAVNRPLRSGSSLTKLEAFKAIKAFFVGNHAPVFDNYFVKRLGLDDYHCEMREVKATRKVGGRMVALCNESEPEWSPVSEEQAIRQIESLQIRYFVASGRERAFLKVVHTSHGPYLRSARDDTTADNLLSLPDC